MVILLCALLHTGRKATQTHCHNSEAEKLGSEVGVYTYHLNCYFHIFSIFGKIILIQDDKFVGLSRQGMYLAVNLASSTA